MKYLPRPNENENFSDYLIRFLSDQNVILEFENDISLITDIANLIYLRYGN